MNYKWLDAQLADYYGRKGKCENKVHHVDARLTPEKVSAAVRRVSHEKEIREEWPTA